MLDFARRFWAAVVSVAGVVGLYLAADAANLVRAFWIVVVVAVVIAAISKGWRWALESATRIRNYPKTLTRIATLEEEVKTLRSIEEEVSERIEKSRNQGRAIGHAEALGVFFSNMVPNLEWTAVGVTDSIVILHARVTDNRLPIEQARYQVRSILTGDVKGTVEVIDTNDTDRTMRLRCVDERDSKFWEKLRDRATLESAPPQGIELLPTSADILELEEVPTTDSLEVME